jgi:hypothetical protein
VHAGALDQPQIKPEQDDRQEPDPWEEAIAEFVESRDWVTVSEVARLGLGLENSRIGKAERTPKGDLSHLAAQN